MRFPNHYQSDWRCWAVLMAQTVNRFHMFKRFQKVFTIGLLQKLANGMVGGFQWQRKFYSEQTTSGSMTPKGD